MINIVFCGYREWALEIFEQASKHPNVNVVEKFISNEDFLNRINLLNPKSIDIVLFIGWSWLISDDVTKKFLCLGIHPSDLPKYRGGSPLQHQIINGLTQSKVTLMTLSDEKIDAGDIWLKEDLDLSGDTMKIIFKNLVTSSIKLLNKFFDNYPNITPIPQDIQCGSFYKRRKPDESKLTKDDFNQKSLEQLYNFIRCLTDPYPNAYLEDEFGNKLIFKEVTYLPKNNTLL